MNSSSSNDLIINLNLTVRYIYKYILPIFYIAGNIGNIISAFIFSKKSWRKNVCVFYFQIYILFCSIYLNATVLASMLSTGYNIQRQNSNAVICKLFFYVAFVFATLSPSVLVFASIDRLLISSQNIDTRLYSSKRLAYFSISLSTIFWIIFNCHILIKVNIQQSYPYAGICYYDLSKTYLDFIFYSSPMINIFYGFLLIILSIISFKNIRHIRVIPNQQRNQIRTMKKKDFQLLRCLFVHDIVFASFKFWIYAYYIYSAVTRYNVKTTQEQALGTFTNNLGNFLYNISYSANFFVFIGISKAFRQEFKRIIYQIIGKNLVILREEDNRQENIEMNVVRTIVTLS